jgi:hypothetical protein
MPARLGRVEGHGTGPGQGDVAGSVKPVPLQVGPVHFETLGKLISVRCPREYAGMMRQHGGEWDPGARRWLIERRRIGPVLRALWRDTDPLFRRVGIDLDG